jgi:mannosyltransferase OCH1-like enzyme
MKDCHIVVKSDMWRLLKLYTEGGVYLDLDRFCNISFSDILTDDIRCVLPTCLDMDFSQDFMMSAPQNPIYLQAYKMSMGRRKQGHTNTYFLGPQTYMHAVTYVLMGEIIDSNPGEEVFAKIRQRLSEIPFIKTYREYPPYDTIIYKHDENTFKMGNSNTSDWVQIKKNFYADFKLKHWTGEW